MKQSKQLTSIERKLKFKLGNLGLNGESGFQTSIQNAPKNEFRNLNEI